MRLDKTELQKQILCAQEICNLLKLPEITKILNQYQFKKQNSLSLS